MLKQFGINLNDFCKAQLLIPELNKHCLRHEPDYDIIITIVIGLCESRN